MNDAYERALRFFFFLVPPKASEKNFSTLGLVTPKFLAPPVLGSSPIRLLLLTLVPAMGIGYGTPDEGVNLNVGEGNR